LCVFGLVAVNTEKERSGRGQEKIPQSVMEAKRTNRAEMEVNEETDKREDFQHLNPSRRCWSRVPLIDLLR
jgi:hypothetical protein